MKYLITLCDLTPVKTPNLAEAIQIAMTLKSIYPEYTVLVEKDDDIHTIVLNLSGKPE